MNVDDAVAAIDAIQSSGRALNLLDLAARQPALVRRLRKFAAASVAAAVGGLMTRAVNHAATARLEGLAHLAMAYCEGTLPVPAANVRQWLNQSLCGDGLWQVEDPPEDVFVSAVVSWDGTSRLFRGVWEANDFGLQSCLYALNRPDVSALLAEVLPPIRGLLRVSEAVAARSHVPRFTVSRAAPRARIVVTCAGLIEVAAAVTFTPDDLAKLGISCADLETFIFAADDATAMRAQFVGHSALERKPLVKANAGTLVLALPTGVSAAIRRFVLEAADAMGCLDVLEREITAHQLAILHESMTLGWDIASTTDTELVGATSCHEFRGTFDTGSVVQVLLAHDDLRAVRTEGLHSINPLLDDLDEHIDAVATWESARPDYHRGLTLVVHGGIGRGFAATFGDKPPGWRVLAVSLHDFLLLGREVDFTAQRAWKLLDLVDHLEASGLKFFNPSGFKNLYAFLEQRSFETPPEAVTTTLVLANNHVLDLRARSRSSLDHHAVRHWKRDRWVEVERRTPSSFFQDELNRPVYVSPLHAVRGELVGCVETPHRVWWLSCEEGSADAAQRSIAFQVWDMALNWMGRAAEVLDELCAELTPVVAAAIIFPDLALWTGKARPPPDRSAPPAVEVRYGMVRIIADVGYLASFGLEANTGDRWMVRALVEGAWMIAGIAADVATLDRAVDRIMPDRDSRFFHNVPAVTAADTMNASLELPKPRLVAPEDLFRIRRGLATLGGFSGRPGPVQDGDAQSLLKGIVDALWSRIRDRLGLLDRGDVIERALLNHASIERERRVWSMTAAAVIALHRDRAATLATANRREGDRARAGNSMRVLVEMAVCAAPLRGGRRCTDIDLGMLAAEVSTLVEAASIGDAIHHGLTDGPLIVRPDMSLGVDNVLASALRGGYLGALGDRAFLRAAAAYPDYFEDPQSGGGRKPESEFNEACMAEFGAGVSVLGNVAEILATRAIEGGSPVFRCRRSVLAALVSTGAGIASSDAAHLIDRMALRPRERWDEDAPDGAKKRDWYPWRFGRKLSVTRRPLVMLSNDVDAELLVSAGLFDRSLHHLVGAHFARLPGEMFDTREMREWIGGAMNAIGHAFNLEVRDELRLLGYRAEAEVDMTALGGAKRLGDIDVLAWRDGSGVIFVIECKRLAQARTVGEIGERLQEYTRTTVSPGPRTPVRKHLDRVEFLRAHHRRLAAFTGEGTATLELKACLVTEDLVPMQFSSKALEIFDVVADIRSLPDRFKA